MRNLTSNISPSSGLHLHHRSAGEPEVRWDVEEHETCKILCEGHLMWVKWVLGSQINQQDPAVTIRIGIHE